MNINHSQLACRIMKPFCEKLLCKQMCKLKSWWDLWSYKAIIQLIFHEVSVYLYMFAPIMLETELWEIVIADLLPQKSHGFFTFYVNIVQKKNKNSTITVKTSNAILFFRKLNMTSKMKSQALHVLHNRHVSASLHLLVQSASNQQQ